MRFVICCRCLGRVNLQFGLEFGREPIAPIRVGLQHSVGSTRWDRWVPDTRLAIN